LYELPRGAVQWCVIHLSCVSTVKPETAGALRVRGGSVGSVLIPVVSVAAALALWELVSRTNTISQRDLPAMSTSFRALWTMLQTGAFWYAFLRTVRGWALGLGIATALAVPLGIGLGSSEPVARAFRVPIEFLRPLPSAALI